MSQNPNNPNVLDPNAVAGDSFDISTSVIGQFFGGLFGTYNFSSGATFDNGTGRAIFVSSGTGNASTVNLASLVTGSVLITGLDTLNFQDGSVINASPSSAAIRVTSNGSNPAIVNFDGDVTGGSGLIAGDNTTVNFSDAASITGTGSGGNGIVVDDNSLLNIAGLITDVSRAIDGENGVTLNIASTATLNVTTGLYIDLDDFANVTISAGATLTSGTSGGGIRVSDNSLLDIQIDLTAGDTALTFGDNNLYVLDAGLFLQSTGADGIRAGLNNTISINGSLIAEDAGISLSGGENDVFIGASGSITSATEDGIEGFGVNNSVTAIGDIFAELDGIDLRSSSTVEVFGNITAGSNAVRVSDDSTITIRSTAVLTTDDFSVAGGDNNVVNINGGATLTGGIGFFDNNDITVSVNATLGDGITLGDDSELVFNGQLSNDFGNAIRVGDRNTVTIGQAADLISLDGDVLRASDDNIITIAGDLTTQDDLFAAITVDTGNTVTLTETGSITSEFEFGSANTLVGDGILLFDENNTAIIEGAITAGNRGITGREGGNNITVTSTGVITARDGILETRNNEFLANSINVQGTLNAEFAGINSFGDETVIDVSGIINGLTSDRNDPNSDNFSTGISVFGDNATLNYSGTINNTRGGISITGDGTTSIVSGAINADGFGIADRGINSELTVTQDSVITITGDNGAFISLAGISLEGNNQTLNFDGTLNTSGDGISTGFDAIVNVSGDINVAQGADSPFGSAEAIRFSTLDSNSTTSALNFTGTITSAADGISTVSGTDILIDGTITAQGAAFTVTGEGNTVTFGASANITGDLNFGIDNETVDLSLATIAENTDVRLGDGDDVFIGSSSGERISVGNGNDIVDGSGGTDTAVINVFFNDAVIENINGVTTIDGNNSFFNEGINQFTNVEFFEFIDITLSLNDLLADPLIEGTAGNDMLIGTLLPNLIFGFAGNDTIDGGGGDDIIQGGDGDDIIEGGDGNDDLIGGSGNDMIFGGDGFDTLEGGEGNDLLDGGEDFDVAVFSQNFLDYTITDNLDGTLTVTDNVGTDGTDTLVNIELLDFNDVNINSDILSNQFIGTSGADVLNGTSRSYILGLEGDDTLTGSSGFDIIVGGAGDDTLDGGDTGAGASDFFSDGTGDDTIIGGAGLSDVIIANDRIEDWIVNLTTGVALVTGVETNSLTGIEAFLSGSGDDSLTGSADRNFLFGGAGEDFIAGLDGNDVLRGQDGNDTLEGGNGDDDLDGGDGDDILDGGLGVDFAIFDLQSSDYTITGNADGSFTLTSEVGDEGTDTLIDIEFASFSDILFDLSTIVPGTNLTNGNDTFTGTTGDDIINALAGDDVINGSLGDDIINGGEGNDSLLGGRGDDVIDGGDGIDQARYANSPDAVIINLATGFMSGTDAAGDTLISIENLFGSNHDDTLTGDSGDNVLEGSNGNDTLNGSGGDDSLIGGNGDDTIIGGIGADFNNGGGGFGDEIDYSGSFEAVEARLGGSQTFDGGFATGDSFQGIENLIGSEFNDTLVGNVRANVLTGNDGADFLNGDRGNDTLLGGDGNDTLIGGFGQDTLDGGAGIDTARYANANSRAVVDLSTGTGTAGHSFGDTLTNIENLFGSQHNDVFTGDAGDNVLNGWNGVDRLNGGEGNDTLIGGAGNDRFIFTDGWDNDTITDFEDGGDLLDFRTVTGVDALSDLLLSTDGNGDAVISFGTDSITLTGIDAADIDAGDFLF